MLKQETVSKIFVYINIIQTYIDRAGFNVSTNTVQVIQETVLQVKRPNQQHQSTEGKVGQPQPGRGSKPTRGLPPCYKVKVKGATYPYRGVGGVLISLP